ncbi:hypothetical protein EDB84DRAFT_1502029 [Lactarius hengduanensis]|nr:hypothetical protein EDB84DRAFT_1502029 [Lactarius hengduanensis]
MSDGPIVWPLRGADGEYNSLALSQHKAPYEVTDPHPPFTAELSITGPYVRAPLCHFFVTPLRPVQVTVENPQIVFTRNNIIWAFSRTPPGSADSDAPISIHHKIGHGMLNLTRPPVPLPPPPPVHPGHSHPHSHPEDEDDHYHDEKAEDDSDGESHDGDDDAVGGGSASFVHGALCTVGFLLVLPSGAWPDMQKRREVPRSCYRLLVS